MCGIAGFLNPALDLGAGTMTSMVRQMTDRLSHRGPDDAGYWVDPGAGVALGHRRLSIIDLSPDGHQPMRSASGRYVIVFNGEIYNFAKIRAELDRAEASPAWRGHSDTEVMLAAYERWGIDGALERFNGMFAFALWDRTDRVLHLARDRMGEKPMYFGSVGKLTAFGSELKSMRILPGFAARIDREAVACLLRHGYVPAPRSIYHGVRKLLPGTRAELRIRDGTVEVREHRYWDLVEVARAGRANTAKGSEDQILAGLGERIEASVEQRLVADVPVGAFLSGGIDSSLIVAMMQHVSARPARTFTIGFDNPDYDEAPYARAVARHLGTDHTEVYVTGKEALSVVPMLPEMYDEPFADSSQIPTFLVSRVARAHVSVVLSGDAGDEVFAGYERHVRGSRLASWHSRVPGWALRAAARALEAPSSATLDQIVHLLNPFVPEQLRFARPGEKLHKLAAALRCEDVRDMYRALVHHWRGEQLPMREEGEPPPPDFGLLAGCDDLPFESWMMLADQSVYLPDDILVKIDRAAMATSLETRIPFLDHELVAHAWSLPAELKLRNGRGKHALRVLLRKFVPDALIERPKRGFIVPLAEWLRGPLREWAESLLDERRLETEGHFDPRRIREVWMQHLGGTVDRRVDLWSVLAFQAWLANFDARP